MPDLVMTLQGAGPFTVFAPTDQAFTDFLAANPTTTILNAGQEADLAELLLYHVVAGATQSSELMDAQVLTSANTAGDMFTINVAAMTGAVSINTDPGQGGNITANVTTANVLANNGIIHVIDEVIVPPGFVLPN